VIVLLAGSTALAVPFFYSGATIVEPQISTLLVGVQENIQRASVSPDRKYVTLDMNISNNAFLGIASFTYQQGGLGFVGSAPKAPAATGTNTNSLTPSIARSPSQVAPAVSILDKRGIVLVAPLER
jgi:hypothetical protein